MITPSGQTLSVKTNNMPEISYYDSLTGVTLKATRIVDITDQVHIPKNIGRAASIAYSVDSRRPMAVVSLHSRKEDLEKNYAKSANVSVLFHTRNPRALRDVIADNVHMARWLGLSPEALRDLILQEQPSPTDAHTLQMKQLLIKGAAHLGMSRAELKETKAAIRDLTW